MCESCGGRCVKCGEFSTTIFEVTELNVATFACDEHKVEVDAYVDDYLLRLSKAALN